MAVESGAPGCFFYVLEDAVRILFVDDDPIMREFAVVHLSTDKAQITVASDGIEALRAVGAEAEFDVILLDLEMPNMDGFEVLTRMRADERTRRLPVIVVTGREDVSAIDRAFQAGRDLVPGQADQLAAAELPGALRPPHPRERNVAAAPAHPRARRRASRGRSAETAGLRGDRPDREAHGGPARPCVRPQPPTWRCWRKRAGAAKVEHSEASEV